MNDDEEIAQYREQMDFIVKHGLITEQEARDIADSIRCVVRLARRGIISVRLANHLIDTMAQRQATLVAERTPSWSLGHA